MRSRKKTQAEELKREDHMANAISFAGQIVHDAELRGLTGYDVAISFAAVLAARNPTLAGKVLLAVRGAILANPVTKVVKPGGDVVDLKQLPDGSFGQAN